MVVHGYSLPYIFVLCYLSSAPFKHLLHALNGTVEQN